MDQHAIWRVASNNIRDMQENAPEGYVPVIEVFLAGRDEPVRLNSVQTKRESDFPWVFLIAETEEHAESYVPEDRLIFAHESTIHRVELWFERSNEKRAIGFTHTTLDVDESPG